MNCLETKNAFVPPLPGFIRSVDRIAEALMQLPVKWHFLHKQYGCKIIYRINPEQSTRSTVPKKLSYPTMVLLFRRSLESDDRFRFP